MVGVENVDKEKNKNAKEGYDVMSVLLRTTLSASFLLKYSALPTCQSAKWQCIRVSGSPKWRRK